MPASPRISALVLARDEAAHLPGCLAALGWADERVVVVDRASRDQTEAIARGAADVVAVRAFDMFAGQRNAALALATGDWVFAVDADERATAELAAEVRRVVADPEAPHAGYRVPIRSVILGRPFAYSGTQHDRPLRLFRRDAGRWVGSVHETVALRGTAGQLAHALQHHTLPDLATFLAKLNTYTTLEAQDFLRQGRPVRTFDLAVRPFWTFAKLYLGKQGVRDGVEGFLFCALSGLSVAVRHWKHRELVRSLDQRPCATFREGEAPSEPRGKMRLWTEPRPPNDAGGTMSPTYESAVRVRFDALEARFKSDVPASDVRLRAVVAALSPAPGRRLLDLGCGKGRFAAHLKAQGAEVVGLDLSAAMLARAGPIDRVRGSARRLPFAAGSFDGVLAVEVLEHVEPRALDAVLDEVRRVLRPGGVVAIVDKNAGALDARRRWLPSLAVKWIDQRRGRWMYPPGAPVRERWFWPGALRRKLRRHWADVRVVYLLAPAEAGRWPFQQYPATRLLTVWTARAPGGNHG